MEEEKEKMPRKRKKNKGEMKKNTLLSPRHVFSRNRKRNVAAAFLPFFGRYRLIFLFFLGVFALFSLPSCHGEMRRKEGKKKDGQNSFAPS